MSYKYFLWGMRLLALFSFAGLLLAVYFLSPYQQQNTEKVIVSNVALLEASLFLALFSGFSLFLFWVRRWGSQDLRKKDLHILAGISLRQGFLLSVLTTALLVMQSFRILTWWDGLLVVGAVMMLELYFLAK
ncbi:MAG: hypothetical protein U5L10_05640 [Candidatus Moranbacteria bacterium]|nr:hypothetical protein [Candidatus Moranbacteria bacterium]